MKNKEQIESIIKEYLGGHPEIVFAYLFGSVVDSESFKDVDIGVYVRDMERHGTAFDYAFRMSGNLERLLGCGIDVIVMNMAPDHLIHSISKGRLIVDRDADTRVTFVTASWSRYFDIEIKRREYLKAIAEESSADEPS